MKACYPKGAGHQGFNVLCKSGRLWIEYLKQVTQILSTLNRGVLVMRQSENSRGFHDLPIIPFCRSLRLCSRDA